MNLELDNKIILVVGGAHGIGASVVTALAGEGAVPFIFDTETPPRELLSRTGALVQTLDLGDSSACEAAVQRVAARFGRIDGLVNGAGEETGPEGSDPLFASVTRSLAHYDLMTRHCLPHLRRVRGSIVSIADHPSIEPDKPGYVALKTGVLGLTSEWGGCLCQGRDTRECSDPRQDARSCACGSICPRGAIPSPRRFGRSGRHGRVPAFGTRRAYDGAVVVRRRGLCRRRAGLGLRARSRHSAGLTAPAGKASCWDSPTPSCTGGGRRSPGS